MGCSQINIALITAKGNNTSIKDKNLIEIAGHPLVYYPIIAAKGAKEINFVYLTTNCPQIASIGSSLGCRIINRPSYLCTTESHHGDTILHALSHIRRELPELSIVCVLLGNTLMVNSHLIGLSIRLLQRNAQYDSVMSVWQAQDDHPLRALCLSKEGTLISYLDTSCGSSRQGYPPAYFYDQGLWTFRQEVADHKEGPQPWWWMGKKVFPIVRNWVTGRDIHTMLDVRVSEWWAIARENDEIINIQQVMSLLGLNGNDLR